MESGKNQVETQARSESAPRSTSFCRRAVKPDENAGFVTNMRYRFTEFVHAPMDEHKACFKETFQKVLDRCQWNQVDDKYEGFKVKVKSVFAATKEDN